MGLKATGIEMYEPYCEIAANRLRQEVFSFEEVRGRFIVFAAAKQGRVNHGMENHPQERC